MFLLGSCEVVLKIKFVWVSVLFFNNKLFPEFSSVGYYPLCNVTNVYRHKKLILPMSRLLQDSSSDKSRPRGSGSSDHVTSPPPISLGRKVEVDLREKQKKFEGLDKQAEEVIINSFTLHT